MVSLKSVFYQFCFCLGLGTASYYAYAQIQQWVGGESAGSRSSSILQDKVQDLIKNEIIAGVDHQNEPSAQTRKASSFVANPNASVDVGKIKVADSPAPEASPAVTAEVSPSPTEGEKTEENKTAENAEGTPAIPEGMAPVLPMAQPFMQPMMANRTSYSPSVATPEQNPSPQANLEVPAMGYVSGPAPASIPAGTGSYGSNSGQTPGSSHSYSNSILSQQDLVILTAPVHATFQDQKNTVNGYVCSQSSYSSCTHQSGVSVHSMRWNFDEGLKSNVNFSVKESSGATPVQFDVSFQIQDRLLNDQMITLTAKPSEVLVHNETRDSKSYRVYEFKMPDTEVTAEDTLTKMQATLVYEVTDTGMVMSPDSKFSFARDQVRTSDAEWDPSAPNQEISQNELYFIADELPYSMSLQKSP